MTTKPDTTDDDPRFLPGRVIDDYAAIARRMREIASEDREEPPQDRKSWCTAIHSGCDWPDCPCGVP